MSEGDRETLEGHVYEIRRVLFGNGQGPGLVKEHEIIMRELFADPKTGEPGLIADVRSQKASLQEFRGEYTNDRNFVRGAVKAIVVLFGIGAISGVMSFIYTIVTTQP